MVKPVEIWHHPQEPVAGVRIQPEEHAFLRNREFVNT